MGKIQIGQITGGFSVYFEPSQHDMNHVLRSQRRKLPGLGSLGFTYQHAHFEGLRGIHPDHLALGICLTFHPYVFKELELPFNVSRVMRQEIFSALGVDLTVNRRESIPDSRGGGKLPGLAISGGQDSTASRLLMPENTKSVFVNRPGRAFQRNLYSSDAARRNLHELSDRGFEIEIVKCDFEFVRRPTGFAVDPDWPDLNFAALAPLLFLADHLNLKSLAMGTVIESFYGLGGQRYLDASQSHYWKSMVRLFQAAGVDLHWPVAGLSEIAIMKLLTKSQGVSANSCIRGKNGDRSCKRCVKCLRKDSFSAFLAGEAWSPQEIEDLTLGAAGMTVFGKKPIHHENVFRYFMSDPEISRHYPLISSRISKIPDEPTGWMDKWYPRANTHVLRDWADSHSQALDRFGISTMSDEEVEWVESWTTESYNKPVPFLRLKSTS